MTKIDKNNTYRTRDGREVRIYATDCGGEYPVHGAVKCAAGILRQVNWTDSGKRCPPIGERPSDLIEVKPRVKKWLNIHAQGGISFFDSEESAESAACGFFDEVIARIPIEYQEGEGL